MTVGGSIETAFAGSLGSFTLDVAFGAPMRGVTALFGPSGSGKTTILRCVAGLQPMPGRLQVGDEIWQDDAAGIYRKPHDRSIGYVFQEASLFSHLSVRNNLLYGARRTARSGPRGTPDFGDVVELLGIGQLLDRAPEGLSGGERQRVALGRALLSRPRLLLMDEPLAALDRMTKEELIPYLEALHESLSIPVFYVSHDIREVERLADHIVLLEEGRVLASGSLLALEANPDLPLLQAPDAAVTLESRVTSVDKEYALTSLSVDGATLVVPGAWGGDGQRHRVRIAASDVSFALAHPPQNTILNCIRAKILSVTPYGDQGNQMNVVAGLGDDGAGSRIAARITRKSQEALALRPGTMVYAQIKSVALVPSGQNEAARRGVTIRTHDKERETP